MERTWTGWNESAEPSTDPSVHHEPVPSATPRDAIEGRDATANPCVNGLGLGTETTGTQGW